MNAALESLSDRLDLHEYLVGDTYTLADCMAAVFVYWAYENNKMVPGTHNISPKMKEWYEKVTQREGFKNTMDKRLTYVIDEFNEEIGKKKK